MEFWYASTFTLFLCVYADRQGAMYFSQFGEPRPSYVVHLLMANILGLGLVIGMSSVSGILGALN
jgi:hypothetical protein